MGEAVIDTNVLVHAVAEDSPRHGEARSLLARLKRWVLPTIVLYELVWVLRKLGVGPQEVRRVVEGILGNPRAVVVPDDGGYARKALRALLEEGRGLAHFNDKVVAAVAMSMGISLATYDEGLRREVLRWGLPTLPAPGA